MINVVKYKDNDEFTKLISLKCDARIIWGGDKTIQKIRNFEINPRAFDLSFADRYSLSIINSKKFSQLKPSEVKSLLNKFYNDTYIVDQNACSSPHLVIWYGKIKKSTIEKFWNSLSEIVDKKYDLTEDMIMTKYTKLCKEIISNNNTSISKYKNNIYAIDLKKLNTDINNFRGVYGYFYQAKIKNLNYLNKIINKKVQTSLILVLIKIFSKNFLQIIFTRN